MHDLTFGTGRTAKGFADPRLPSIFWRANNDRTFHYVEDFYGSGVFTLEQAASAKIYSQETIILPS